MLEVAALARGCGAGERGADPGALLPHEVGRAAALGHGGGERGVVLVLAAAAEDHVDAVGERADADHRRGDVRGLGVVDVEDAAEAPDLLEAMLDAGEGPQRVGDGRGRQAAGEAHAAGRHRVLQVVLAAQPHLGDGQDRLAPPRQDAVARTDVAVAAEEHALGCGRDLVRERLRQHRDRAGVLVGEDLQLRLAVGGEGAVAVEVVRREVEEHRGVGREGERVLELEGRRLADDGRRRVEGAGERRQRRADIAGRGHGHTGRAVHRRDELGRRRLPVRARDRDQRVRQEPPAELELADHDDPAPAGCADDRGLAGHAGALDHGPDAVEQRDPVAVLVHGDAGRLELGARLRSDGRAVAAGHLLAERAEDQAGGATGAGEADEQERAGRERRTGHPGSIEAGAAVARPPIGPDGVDDRLAQGGEAGNVRPRRPRTR